MTIRKSYYVQETPDTSGVTVGHARDGSDQIIVQQSNDMVVLTRVEVTELMRCLGQLLDDEVLS